jgi:hypothetical protein
MTYAGDNVVNDFIIGQSFDDKSENSRGKEFTIDNAEYAEIKPRNLKRKVLIVALSLVGIVGVGVVVGIQKGYIGQHQESHPQTFTFVQSAPVPAATVSLPASLQTSSSHQAGVPLVKPNANVQAQPAATPLPTALPAATQALNAAPAQTAAIEPTKALPQASTPDKQFSSSLAAPAAPVIDPKSAQAANKVEPKPAEVKAVASKPVDVPDAQSQPNVAAHKPAPVVVAKKSAPPVHVKQPADQNARYPILANTPDHTDGSVKPLSIVSADRIGLRGLTKNGIQLQRGGSMSTYGVGDTLPNGETIKYIDDKTMTIVTDKQVMRVTDN